jgi:hypothetical protein
VDVDRADVDRVAGGSTWTGDGATGKRCNTRHVKGLPTWKIVRYADNSLVLFNGARQNTEALRDQIARVLAPLALRLSAGDAWRSGTGLGCGGGCTRCCRPSCTAQGSWIGPARSLTPRM